MSASLTPGPAPCSNGGMTTNGYPIPRGAIVEFFSQGHGPRLGIVTNIPPVHVVAQVSHVRADGTVCGYDADGRRVTVPVDATVLTEAPEAGWGSL